MNEKHCYLCNGKSEVLFKFDTGKKGVFNLMQCLDCGFLRIDPIPDQVIIDRLYKDKAMSRAQLDKEVFSKSLTC